MELHDYVRVLRKHIALILLCTVLAVAAALVVTVRATPLYRTSVGFFVSTADAEEAGSGGAYAGSLFSQQRVKSYASIVGGPLVAERVAADLGQESSAVEGRLSGAPVPDTVLLHVSVTDASPQHALSIAQSVARLFPELAAELEKPSLSRDSTVKVSVIQKPRLPGAAFSPRPTRNIGLALVIGVLLGVGLAVVREALDNTVKTPEDIRAVTGSATLGAITYDSSASKKPLIVQDSPQSARSEAFRQLRTNLRYIEIDEPLRSLVVTSSLPKEGKSTTACNLALTMAQAGVRTVLIEGDLRRPRVADYLGMEGAVGLTSVLIGRVSLDEALQDFGDGTLKVLASGPLPPNPSELLTSLGMRDLIALLEDQFDVVLIDAPPLLPVTDGAVLATMCSGAVLGVRCGSTKREQLRRAAEALSAVDAKLLGAVLNMVPRRGGHAYGGYAGYSGYGANAETSYGADDPLKPRMSVEDAALALRGPNAAEATPGGHQSRHSGARHAGAQAALAETPAPAPLQAPPRPTPQPAQPARVSPVPGGGAERPELREPQQVPTPTSIAPATSTAPAARLVRPDYFTATEPARVPEDRPKDDPTPSQDPEG